MPSSPRRARSKPVRAVLFDLDHTLFDTNRSEKRALAKVAESVDIPFGARALAAYREINTFVWSEYRAGRLTSKELRVMRFHLWLQKMDKDPAHAKRLAPMYLEEFSSRSDLISGATLAVRQVAKTGARLGVVTNGIDRVQRRRLKASDLHAAFPVVVTSERAGFTKPDPRIMEIALKRLRVDPDEAVYVGDDFQVDGLAANRSSMGFVWFNPRGEARKPGAEIRVDYEISSLREISALVTPR